MADITVNPLSQIAAVQRNSQNASSSNPASGLSANPNNGTFAQELKARTPTQQTPKPAQTAQPKQPQQAQHKAAGSQSQSQSQTQEARSTDAEATDAATADVASTELQGTTPTDSSKLLESLGLGDKDSDEKHVETPAAEGTPQLIATPFLPANTAAAANTAADADSDRMLANLTAAAQSQNTLAQTDGQSTDKLALLGTEKAADKTLTSLATTEGTDPTKGVAADIQAPTSNTFATDLEQARQAMATATRESAQPTPAAQQQVVHTPVGIHGWADEVGQHVTWAAQHDNGRAELVLTPAHLGRVEVSINVNGDQASAYFVAASSAAREALEDSLPRLREILSQAGIQLGQANVSSGGQGNPTQADGRNNPGLFGGGSVRGIGAELPMPSAQPIAIRRGNGLVDTFA